MKKLFRMILQTSTEQVEVDRKLGRHNLNPFEKEKVIKYGTLRVEHGKPLKARLEGDVWIVTGALPKGEKAER